MIAINHCLHCFYPWQPCHEGNLTQPNDPATMPTKAAVCDLSVCEQQG